jgi:hypothetical protein
MHEAQAHYIRRALRIMTRRRLSAVEIRERVMRGYNAKIQAAMQGTVWLAGCTNYFTAPSGKVVTQLPYSAGQYWLRTRVVGFWRYHRRRGRRRATTIDAGHPTPYDRTESRM